MYPRLVLPLRHLPEFLRATTKHDEYDDDLNVEEGEVPTEVGLRIPPQPKLTYGTKEVKHITVMIPNNVKEVKLH